MKKLTKTIRRELHLRCDAGKFRGNPIILEVQPGDVLSFRIKATKQRFEISLAHCYNMAQQYTLDKLHEQAMNEYKLKQKRGERARKPVKPNLHFTSKLYR